MNNAQLIPLIVVASSLLLMVVRFTGLPQTLVLVLGGMLVGLLPGLPRLALDPAIVFQVVLPPLLYGATFYASPRLLRTTLWSAFVPSVLLIGATGVLVAGLARALIPNLPWTVAALLGIVAAAVDTNGFAEAARRLRVARRYNDRLKVEQLIAPAILLSAGVLAFEVALGTPISAPAAIGRFVLDVTGGALVGAGVAVVYIWLRRRIRVAALEIAVSVGIPYAASLAAGLLGVSTIVAVLAAGFVTATLYLRSGVATQRASAELRLVAEGFWSQLRLVLAAMLLVLIGMGLPPALAQLRTSESPLTLVTWALVVLGAVLAIRFAFMLALALLVPLPDVTGASPPPGPARRPLAEAALLTWGGARSVTAVVIALLLPAALPDGSPFPMRDLVIAVTGLLVLCSALLQGLTLAPVVRTLGFAGDAGELHEEQAARAAAARAGLRQLDDRMPAPAPDDTLMLQLRHHYMQRVAPTPEADAQTFVELRRQTLDAELGAVRELHARNALGDEALGRIQHELDLEAERLKALPFRII